MTATDSRHRGLVKDRGQGGPILIADDNAVTRTLIATVLQHAGFGVTEAESGDEAIDLARRERPSVVILEVNLPALSGYEVCHQLREAYGAGLPVILVSAERTEPFDRVAGILIGADDYVVKPLAPDELLARVRRLVRSATPAAPGMASKLTPRETEVLGLLTAGHDPADIAVELVITRRTVGTHIENIMRKLGVRSRAQAVALAYREDLVGSGR